MISKLIRNVSNMSRKELAFWLFAVVVAQMNIHYMHTDFVLTNLAIRIPQVLLLGFVYRKFIKKNNKMKNPLNGFRIKNQMLHYLTMFVGVFMYAFTVHTKLSNTGVSVSELNTLLETNFTTTVIALAISFVISLPYAYLLVQIMSYSIRLTAWVYNNKPSYFMWFLCLEEVFYVTTFTFIF